MRKVTAGRRSARGAAKIRYRGGHLRSICMPMGGIGTGSIGLSGDGSLRQWQIHNLANNLGHIPHSFFAVRTDGFASLLQSAAHRDGHFQPVPMRDRGIGFAFNDHIYPDALKKLTATLPVMQTASFAGRYPFAWVTLSHRKLPLQVTLCGFSPMCPLQAEMSSIPGVVMRVLLRNTGNRTVKAELLGTLQNAVGYDGKSAVDGVRSACYGGNTNHAIRLPAATGIVMENACLSATDEGWGSMALAVEGEGSVCVAWDDPEKLWHQFTRGALPLSPENAASTPSKKGETVNGAVLKQLTIGPGRSVRIHFYITWSFPNFYTHGFRTGMTSWRGHWLYHADACCSDREGHFWIGNDYCRRYPHARDALRYLSENIAMLTRKTEIYTDTMYRTSLPEWMINRVTANTSTIRTPTCIWIADGTFHGFEGGDSRLCRDGRRTSGGCCPMNCTHVWNYEMALANLYPNLERSMRETDLFVQMRQDGCIPHRTVLPFHLPRKYGFLPGPLNPALDGMCGTVLKTYREYLHSPDARWLKQVWPRVRMLMRHILDTYDPDQDGVIECEQPNTYDRALFGANSFIGSMFLAALRAGEEMAKICAEKKLAASYRARFEQGRENYDRRLWNGEYFEQEMKPGLLEALRMENARKAEQAFADWRMQARMRKEKFPAQRVRGMLQGYYNPHHAQYGKGCLADQLLGQWWAHVLGLGYVLPRSHVRKALKSIFQYNFRDNFHGFDYHGHHILAHGDDAGLVNCTWPKGGRPDAPIAYADEVWTGVEYTVAAMLMFEGLRKRAYTIVKAVHDRYDGRRMNPFNALECGDHYVRAMSSWSLLDAASGIVFDTPKGDLRIAPNIKRKRFRVLLITGTAWGAVDIAEEGRGTTLTIQTTDGTMSIKRVHLRTHRRRAAPRKDGVRVASSTVWRDGTLHIVFARRMRLNAGQTLLMKVL